MNRMTQEKKGSVLKKFLFYGLILFIILIIAAATAIKIFFPADKIRSMALAVIEESLNRPVSIDRVSLRILKGFSVSVKGIEIGNQDGFEGPPLLSCPLVSIEVDLSQFLRLSFELNKLRINTLRIVRPEISIQIREDGSSNLDGIGGEAVEEGEEEDTDDVPPTLPFLLTVDNLNIEDASFTYTDAGSGLSLSLHKINETLSLDMGSSMENVNIKGKLLAKETSLIINDKSEPIMGLDFTLSQDIGFNIPGQIIDIRELTLEILGQKLVVKGLINEFMDIPNLDLTCNLGTVQLADIIKKFPENLIKGLPKADASGSLSFSAMVHGKLKTGELPSFLGEMSLDHIRIHYPGLPREIEEITGKLTITEKDIPELSLVFRSGENTLNLQGNISDYLEKPNVDIVIDFLCRLNEIEYFYPLPEGVSLEGETSGNLVARGSVEEPFKMDVHGQFAFSGIKVISPGMINGTLEINGNTTLNPKIIRADSITGSIGTSDFTISGKFINYLSLLTEREESKGKFPTPKLTFNVTSNNFVLSDILPEKEEPGEEEQKSSGAVMIGPLPGIDVQGTVRAKRIVTGLYTITNLTTSLTSSNNRLNLNNLSMNTMEGNIRGQAWLDVSDTTRVTYGMNCDLRSLEINEILGILPYFKDHVFGKTSARLRFTGAGLDSSSIVKNLRGEARFSISSGKIVNWDFAKRLSDHLGFVNFDTTGFNDFTGGFHIENQKILWDSFRMKTPHAGIVSGGFIGLDGSLGLELNMSFSKAFSEKASGGLLQSVTGLFKDEDGIINLDILIDGNANSPSFKIDTSKAKERLKKKAEDTIKKETDKLIDSLKDKTGDEAEKLKEELKKKGKKLLKKLF